MVSFFCENALNAALYNNNAKKLKFIVNKLLKILSL